MLENMNELIAGKISQYPDTIQSIILKALELADTNQPIGVAEQLEGFARDLTKGKNNHT
jgi:hypothetical protein